MFHCLQSIDVLVLSNPSQRYFRPFLGGSFDQQNEAIRAIRVDVVLPLFVLPVCFRPTKRSNPSNPNQRFSPEFSDRIFPSISSRASSDPDGLLSTQNGHFEQSGQSKPTISTPKLQNLNFESQTLTFGPKIGEKNDSDCKNWVSRCPNFLPECQKLTFKS